MQDWPLPVLAKSTPSFPQKGFPASRKPFDLPVTWPFCLCISVTTLRSIMKEMSPVRLYAQRTRRCLIHVGKLFQNDYPVSVPGALSKTAAFPVFCDNPLLSSDTFSYCDKQQMCESWLSTRLDAESADSWVHLSEVSLILKPRRPSLSVDHTFERQHRTKEVQASKPFAFVCWLSHRAGVLFGWHLAAAAAVTTILQRLQNPASLVFRCELRKGGSPGVFQIFRPA